MRLALILLAGLYSALIVMQVVRLRDGHHDALWWLMFNVAVVVVIVLVLIFKPNAR